MLFEISATELPGMFDVNAKFMGVSMEKVELVFQVSQLENLILIYKLGVSDIKDILSRDATLLWNCKNRGFFLAKIA